MKDVRHYIPGAKWKEDHFVRRFRGPLLLIRAVSK
jgi:hypothetical protein